MQVVQHDQSCEEEWQSRQSLRISHNNDATGEEFQKHKTFQAEMFWVYGTPGGVRVRPQRTECSGGVAQDEMTQMVRRPRGRRLWTAAALGVLMQNRPVGCPEEQEFQSRMSE